MAVVVFVCLLNWIRNKSLDVSFVRRRRNTAHTVLYWWTQKYSTTQSTLYYSARFHMHQKNFFKHSTKSLFILNLDIKHVSEV